MQFVEHIKTGQRYIFTDALAARADFRVLPPAEGDAESGDIEGPSVESHSASESEPESFDLSAMNRDDLMALHWKQLQQMLDAYGGIYSDKTSAVEFLLEKK